MVQPEIVLIVLCRPVGVVSGRHRRRNVPQRNVRGSLLRSQHGTSSVRWSVQTVENVA